MRAEDSKFLDLIIKFPGTSYSSIVDNEGAAVALAGAANGRGMILPAFIDLNTGMRFLYIGVAGS